ncbi:MAG TPA: hypothetical protein VMH84_07730 [Xanthobacteraceae bacterium]|nr:hypothetical protein [Xanthobacteraceae bacterium]
MSDPIFDNLGNQIAQRVGSEAVSLDGKKAYDIDANGNLLDKETRKVVGHLIPSGKFLPDGRPSPTQNLF